MGLLLTRTSSRSTFSAVSTVVTFSPSLNHSRMVAANPAEIVGHVVLHVQTFILALLHDRRALDPELAS